MITAKDERRYKLLDPKFLFSLFFLEVNKLPITDRSVICTLLIKPFQITKLIYYQSSVCRPPQHVIRFLHLSRSSRIYILQVRVATPTPVLRRSWFSIACGSWWILWTYNKKWWPYSMVHILDILQQLTVGRSHQVHFVSSVKTIWTNFVRFLKTYHPNNWADHHKFLFSGNIILVVVPTPIFSLFSDAKLHSRAKHCFVMALEQSNISAMWGVWKAHSDSDEFLKFLSRLE